jgi:hypothetical protein
VVVHPAQVRHQRVTLHLLEKAAEEHLIPLRELLFVMQLVAVRVPKAAIQLEQLVIAAALLLQMVALVLLVQALQLHQLQTLAQVAAVQVGQQGLIWLAETVQVEL